MGKARARSRRRGSPSAVVTCLMCLEKRAVFLQVRTHGTKENIVTPRMPIFCSRRCASNWGLLNVPLTELHWCNVGNKWEYIGEEYCPRCNEYKVI